MLTTPSPQARRASLLAFVTLAAVGLCAAEPVRAQQPSAKSNEMVTLSVRISVTDKGDGSPVRGAEVTIRRQGTNPAGMMLKDRTARTDTKGEVSMREADFRLGGPPHKVVVTAEGFRKQELELPDVVLREAAHIDGQLTLALSLARPNGQASPNSVAPSPTGDVSQPDEPLLYRPRVWVSTAAVLLMLSIVAFVAWQVWLSDWWWGPPRARGGTGVFVVSQTRRPIRQADEATAAGRTSAAPSGAEVESMLAEIGERIKAIERGLSFTQDNLAKMASTLQRLADDVSGPRRPIPPRAAEKGPAVVKPQPMPAAAATPSAGRDAARPLPFRERARLSYFNLANGKRPELEPRYLQADRPDTLLDRLAGSKGYLKEVAHRHVRFVLFTEDGKQGWVFPNPALAFRRTALKDVFPGLAEADFESAKENIQPARVSRVDEGRWKVEPAG